MIWRSLQGFKWIRNMSKINSDTDTFLRFLSFAHVSSVSHSKLPHASRAESAAKLFTWVQAFFNFI